MSLRITTLSKMYYIYMFVLVPAARHRDVIPPTSHRERPDGAESTNDIKALESSAKSNKSYINHIETTNNRKSYKQNSNESLMCRKEYDLMSSNESGVTQEKSLNIALQKLSQKQQQRQYQPKPGTYTF